MFNKTAAFLEELIGLAGEADHYVGADRGVGHGFMDLSDLFRIMPGAVLAMHPPENAVTAGLQRNMRVLGDSRRVGAQRDQVVAPIHRFNRADADFFYAGILQQSAD